MPLHALPSIIAAALLHTDLSFLLFPSYRAVMVFSGALHRAASRSFFCSQSSRSLCILSVWPAPSLVLQLRGLRSPTLDYRRHRCCHCSAGRRYFLGDSRL